MRLGFSRVGRSLSLDISTLAYFYLAMLFVE
jgi:hypothetical protein